MFTIVVPLYNKRRSISSTILSILNQSYKEYELIIVNDGSTDGSEIEVSKIKDPRIKLLTKPNGGVSSARNLGILNASHPYVVFLDADDTWEPNFLSEICKMIGDFPDCSMWGTSYWYMKNGVKILANKPFPSNFYGIVDNTAWNFGHIFCSSAVCCRKSALLKVGMFDERIAMGEDLDVWWRLMLNYSFAYSNTPLAVYRFDEENRAMNKLIPLDKHYIFYFEKYESYRLNNGNFRHFIDKECMWWLYKYIFTTSNQTQIKRILANIDLSEYKWTFKFRFKFPRVYNFFKKMK